MLNAEIQVLKEPPFKSRHPKPIEYSIDPVTGCWIVVSHALNCTGYPLVQRNGQRMHAHRYSYELAFDPIPDGLYVCHHCDNKRCINPEHLFLGTQADNMQDAVQKGRIARGIHVAHYGEANGRSKLIEADVRAIRADKTLTQGELGKRFGIGHVQISRIKSGERWVHIPLSNKAQEV
jgi:hypothetical protein